MADLSFWASRFLLFAPIEGKCVLFLDIGSEAQVMLLTYPQRSGTGHSAISSALHWKIQVHFWKNLEEWGASEERGGQFFTLYFPVINVGVQRTSVHEHRATFQRLGKAGWCLVKVTVEMWQRWAPSQSSWCRAQRKQLNPQRLPPCTMSFLVKYKEVVHCLGSSTETGSRTT